VQNRWLRRPSKAKQSKAKQSKAKQSKAKQSKAKQSKAKQSKAKNLIDSKVHFALLVRIGSSAHRASQGRSKYTARSTSMARTAPKHTKGLFAEAPSMATKPTVQTTGGAV
jgi:mannitol-specific phosphotransferase system IIBC component